MNVFAPPFSKFKQNPRSSGARGPDYGEEREALNLKHGRYDAACRPQLSRCNAESTKQFMFRCAPAKEAADIRYI